ncbi:MAG: response regulator transcription factor [Pleurocapsa minor GSE-CHR-MK-17-07R]|jgi:DNA-binding NarL/FixJ family response regulator|nr:response regulator transcription factor [Pleurocapsa minor GSE-CHR-MK 17-07R]
MTTILLADDHQILRQGLRKLLEEEPGFIVVGETGDGLEAAALTQKLRPDILVVDMIMPGLNGLDVIRQVRQYNQHTRIIVLSMHANEAYVVEALRHGASGYLLKESSSTELIQAIREVMVGHRYLTSSLSERALNAYIQNVGTAITDPFDLLTERERQVMHLVAEGHSNADIAVRLSIGVRTVETHRANLFAKLGLKNQNELIRYAIQRGIIP